MYSAEIQNLQRLVRAGDLHDSALREKAPAFSPSAQKYASYSSRTRRLTCRSLWGENKIGPRRQRVGTDQIHLNAGKLRLNDWTACGKGIGGRTGRRTENHAVCPVFASTTLFRDTVNSMTREKFREMTMSLSAVSSRRQVPVLSSTLPRSSIRLDTR